MFSRCGRVLALVGELCPPNLSAPHPHGTGRRPSTPLSTSPSRDDDDDDDDGGSGGRQARAVKVSVADAAAASLRRHVVGWPCCRCCCSRTPQHFHPPTAAITCPKRPKCRQCAAFRSRKPPANGSCLYQHPLQGGNAKNSGSAGGACGSSDRERLRATGGHIRRSRHEPVTETVLGIRSLQPQRQRCR